MIFRRKRRRTGPDKSALAFPVVPSPTKVERNAPRNRAIGALRIRVIREARGRCAYRCTKGGEPSEAHHLFGGKDRRALESPYTLAPLCDDCHDKADASPAWNREQALAWARREAAAARAARDEQRAAGFDETAAELERRIALAQAQGARS